MLKKLIFTGLLLLLISTQDIKANFMNRPYFLEAIDKQFEIHSVCAILGPRQVGKTTLAKLYAEKYPNMQFFDLENPIDLARLDNPMLALRDLENDLVIIDEVQRRPDLFPILRVLVDEKPRKFLILGSASRDLLQQSSETLAGRIGYIELPTFMLSETHETDSIWLRGGFPRSYLAKSMEASNDWRMEYIRTIVERDIPALGFNVPSVLMRRLWMMLAHDHGNILNLLDISKSLMISNHTLRKYINVLEDLSMVRQLQPWIEKSISKRQVKSPKVYIRDSGLLHTLLDIGSQRELDRYPRLGASWEGFALEETIKAYKVKPEECYFWATQQGAKVDLLIFKGGKRLGFEFKYTDYPTATKSMHIALEDLKLDHLYLVHPHEKTFPIAENMTALGIDSFYKPIA